MAQQPISEAFIRIRYAADDDELEGLRRESDRTFGRMRRTATQSFDRTERASRQASVSIRSDFRRTESAARQTASEIESSGRGAFRGVREESDRALSGIRGQLNDVREAFGSGGIVGGLSQIPGVLAGIAGAVAGIGASILALDGAVGNIRASNEELRSLAVADPRRARQFQRDFLQGELGLTEDLSANLVRQYIQAVGAERFNQGDTDQIIRDLAGIARLSDVDPGLVDAERLARLERSFGQGNFAEAARQIGFVSSRGGLAPEILDSFIEDAGRFRGAGFTNQQILSAQLAGARTDISAQDLNVVYDQTFVKLAEDPELRQRLGLDRFQDAASRFGTVQSLIEAVALAQGDESTAEQRLYLERTTGAQAGQFSADVAVYASGLQAFRFPDVQNRQGLDRAVSD